MAEKHTPTPWRLTEESAGCACCASQGMKGYAIRGANDQTVTVYEHDSQAPDEIDCAFIIKAVNSHEALVNALRQSFSIIEEYRRAFDDYNLFLGDDTKRFDESIRAALKLAED